ncbi:Diaminopimelate epimerase-like protein [Sistotremastrum suecicum HHB10207 ss-3]|uniref:Diaminopimelate epimerase-like protein n=1 Tax=Sistotremastrum suecicum HHB10207 ss-3 TaxID=1314776 RepID=A0A166J355_9AGAM|nr:Diaminopimelate epimerase-like protein [Sistotremastrum suecicum HHB10207 ss-3]
MAAVQAIDFSVINAFTTSAFKGNPAAVVVLQKELPTDLLQSIARELNLPVTTFITPLPGSGADPTNFSVRWFVPSLELPLCGHGTIAAAHYIFSRSAAALEAGRLVFQTRSGSEVVVTNTTDGRYALQLPVEAMQSLDQSSEISLRDIFSRALGCDPNLILSIRAGTNSTKTFVLVEVDNRAELAKLEVDKALLRGTAPFVMNIVTSSTDTEDVTFVSRVFAPLTGVDEDHVCGIAHTLLGPYWSEKKSIPNGEELVAKQVSPRGGDLGVVWEAAKNVCILKGSARLALKGTLYV